MEIEGEARITCPHCGKEFDAYVTIEYEPIRQGD